MATLLCRPWCSYAQNSEAAAEKVGIGVEWKLDHSALHVVKVLAGGPAQRAGVVAGDRVLAVDGKLIGKLQPDQLAALLDGKPGTKIVLTVMSKGKEAREVGMVRGPVAVPAALSDAVLAAAKAHRLMRAQPPAREERLAIALPEFDVLREAIRREARFMAAVGGLTPDETERLAEEGAKALSGRRAGILVDGNRIIHRHFVVVDGRRELRAEYSQTLEQVARRELTQTLKDLFGDAWQDVDAERERLEQRSRQADVLLQVAALDDALLLTAQQRDDWHKLLAGGWQLVWRGYSSNGFPPQPLMLCVSPAAMLGRFEIQPADLKPLLRASQQEAFRALQLPTEPTLEEHRRRLESRLTLLIEDADTCAPLSQDQKQKLLLAGKLDLDRCFQPPATRERRAVKRVLAAEAPGAASAGTAAVPPPIFSDRDSSFQKALRGRLGAEERDKLLQAEHARVGFRQRALVQALTVALADRAALADDQAQHVYDWLTERLSALTETDSTAAWGRAALSRLGQLRPEELEPLVDDWQRPALRAYAAALAIAARRVEANPSSAPGMPEVAQELLVIPAAP